MIQLKILYHEGKPFYYREGTTDERVFQEVVVKKCYRRSSLGFEVNPGERWLDLGANCGAFAFYCQLREANITAYEPIYHCFEMLRRNAGHTAALHNASVSASRLKKLTMYEASSPGNLYRGTLLPAKGRMKKTGVLVSNVYAGDITEEYDGIKMDIEGAEFGILDEWLLPKCKKLCFEYHTSRDDSMENLQRRLEILKKQFSVVKYPKELDRMVELGGFRKSWNDRVIFCLA